MKPQTRGIIITAASLLVLSLLIVLKVQTDDQLLAACGQSCEEQSGVSCSLDSCPYHQGNQ